MKPSPNLPEIGSIENGVAIGHDRTLFLAGGAHDPLAFVTGERAPTSASIATFRDNLRHRSAWAGERRVTYLHIIFPDKQSYAPELWPFGTPRRLGDVYLAACDWSERGQIWYPTGLLHDNRGLVTSRVDTHLSTAGAALVASELAARITGHNQTGTLARILADMTKPRETSGDLGSKLSPPWTDTELVDGVPAPDLYLTNQSPGGNNGIVDIRFAPGAPHACRVLIFGDSFARQVAAFLPWFVTEILVCRSPFFHPDIAELYRPNVLITSNAERYLAEPLADATRPLFLMCPWLGDGGPHVPSAPFARALSAVLSYPRSPYRTFIASLAK